MNFVVLKLSCPYSSKSYHHSHNGKVYMLLAQGIFGTLLLSYLIHVALATNFSKFPCQKLLFFIPMSSNFCLHLDH